MVLGKCGVINKINFELDEDESICLQKSIDTIKENIAKVI